MSKTETWVQIYPQYFERQRELDEGKWFIPAHLFAERITERERYGNSKIVQMWRRVK